MQYKNPDKWVVHKRGYDIVPESHDDDVVDTIKVMNEEVMNSTRGWNKSKTMKKLGTVPLSVMYNYAQAHGVPNHMHHEFFTVDKGKHMKELLNEFTCFRVGDAMV